MSIFNVRVDLWMDLEVNACHYKTPIPRRYVDDGGSQVTRQPVSQSTSQPGSQSIRGHISHTCGDLWGISCIECPLTWQFKHTHIRSVNYWTFSSHHDWIPMPSTLVTYIGIITVKLMQRFITSSAYRTKHYQHVDNKHNYILCWMTAVICIFNLNAFFKNVRSRYVLNGWTSKFESARYDLFRAFRCWADHSTCRCVVGKINSIRDQIWISFAYITNYYCLSMDLQTKYNYIHKKRDTIASIPKCACKW